MQKKHDKQNEKAKSLPWELIMRYTFIENSDFKDIDTELLASPLNNILRKLGLAQERVHHIFSTVSTTVTQAKSHILSGRTDLPVTIHVFCQGKLLASALRHKNLGQSDSPISADLFHEFLDLNITLEPSEPKNSGGWGFFIIERGADLSITHQEAPCVLELYLYREVDY